MQQHLQPAMLAVDEAAIQRYARITGDFNPIHVDPAFAAQTEMGGVIAHGTMSLNLIWQALEATLGREGLATVTLDIRFRRPVRPGDVIEGGGALDPDRASYSVWARNQRGENVIEGTASLG
jgi:3-hydroxybutyryl-CoA dehydratase